MSSTLLDDDARYHNLYENNETTWRSKKKSGFPIRANVGIRPFDRQYTSRYRFLISKLKIKIFPIGKKNRLRYCIGINLKNFFRQKNDFLKIVGYALLNVHSSFDLPISTSTYRCSHLSQNGVSKVVHLIFYLILLPWKKTTLFWVFLFSLTVWWMLNVVCSPKLDLRQK